MKHSQIGPNQQNGVGNLKFSQKCIRELYSEIWLFEGALKESEQRQRF